MRDRTATLPDGGMLKGQPGHEMVISEDCGAPPSRFVECGYYFSLSFTVFASALQLAVPMVGIGMLVALTALCALRLRSRRITVYAPIAFPLACAISFVLIQVFVHSESLFDANVRPFVTWILAIIIVHSLSLRRGFLHRFAIVALAIGVTTLPYLQVYTATSMFERAGFDDDLGFFNANGLAAWFGFCAVYFTIAGIETERAAVRVASWLTTVGCLYIIGLTVSRASLLATAISIVVALRRVLKRGFLPLLFLLGFIWFTYESGLFDRITDFYVARGTFDTGRASVWPLVLERFYSAPYAGVGVSDMATYVPSKGHEITPHNGFLYFALASGIMPLTLYMAYWCHVALKSFRAHVARMPDAPYLSPLLIYTFLIVQASNYYFMQPWAVVTLCTAMTAGAPRQRLG